MASELVSVQGFGELRAKLSLLSTPRELNKATRAMVRDPMRIVMRTFKQNIAAVSPGLRDVHRTYKDRLVTAGFAARSVRMAVRVVDGVAYSVLGVLAEAFYVLQFIELGTARIQATPTLVPAFSSNRSAALSKMGETMNEYLEKVSALRKAG